jgi:hypothetical protein
MKPNSPLFKIIVIFLCFIFIDKLFWGELYWKIPNESSWGTDFFYNYNYEKNRLEEASNHKERVLIIGSSIARYSFETSFLEDYLKTRGYDKEVRLLSHAGMTPIDAYGQRDSIEKMKPSLIIYPLNFVDFRIFRTHELFPEKKLIEISESEMIRDALEFRFAPQVKSAYPWNVLRDFSTYLSLENKAIFLSSGLFSFYRYREFGWDNFKTIYNHRFSRNTSYFWYQGIQIPERVSTLGWTGRKFSFPVKAYMKEKGFYIQIVPEILRKGPLIIKITSVDKTEIFEFKDTGWKQILLKNFGVGDFVNAELSDVFIPFDAEGDRFDYAKEEMGVRLQETFGLDKPRQNYHVIREERSEDLRFLNMTEKEYEEYFQFRLLQDREKRPGLVTMQLYKESKEKLNKEEFREFFHYKYLKQFTEEMKKRKIPTLFILNPENPYSLAWYKDANYLQEEAQFFKSLEGDGIVFWNLHSYLQGKDFSDYHHMTYKAVEKMNPVYGKKIIELLKK